MRRAGAALLLVLLAGPAAADPVTQWTDEADALGGGNANWHSLAIMHMAMHDALNAAEPVYARWAPATANEPAGGDPQAAMAQAAATVLAGLHPGDAAGIARLRDDQLAALPPGPARDAGVALGRAVGRAALARRAGDGFTEVRDFPGEDAPGRWRPVPAAHATSGITNTRPFLFAGRDAFQGAPPPAVGSPRALRDAAETRAVGAAGSATRTPAQTEAALFWAYQSTQRGFMHLVSTALDAAPRQGGLAEHARVMSQAAAAMADAAILIWDEKARHSYWRPITLLRGTVEPDWTPLIETPPHPEYPSGHAADCFTGTLFLQAVLGPQDAPVTYTAQSALPDPTRPPKPWTSDMGDPAPPLELRPLERHYPSLRAAAQDCADSRIWAGVHFRSANEASERVAQVIVARALSAVPRLAP